MSSSTAATAAGFRGQLMPLLADRTLMVIVSKADDQHLTFSIVPKRMKESKNAALTPRSAARELLKSSTATADATGMPKQPHSFPPDP